MNFSELLTALGMETHLNLKQAAHSGACTISFDKDLEVTFELSNESQGVQLYATLMNAPVLDREKLFAVLLQIHLFGMATNGAYFGFDPQLNRIIFFKTIELALIDQANALQQVETYINQLERWRANLPHLINKASSQPTPTIASAQRMEPIRV